MKIIWGKKKKTPSSTNVRPKTLREILNDAFKTELDKDPELKKKIAFKEFGHEGMLDEDPVGKKKRELKTKMLDHALKKITTNTEYADRFSDGLMEEIVGEGSNRHSDYSSGDGFGGGSSISQVLEEMDDYDALRERMGGKSSGGLGSMFKDPEVITAVAALVGALTGKQGNGQSTYIVQIDGKNVKVSESEFNQLQQAGRLNPVAQLKQPEEPKKEPTAETPDEISGEIPEEGEPLITFTTGAELPEFMSQIDLAGIVEKMELEPQEYVDNLKMEVEAEIQESKFLWGLFSNTTYDGIVALITPYKDNQEVGPHINKIMSSEGQDWVERVIELVKEQTNE